MTIKQIQQIVGVTADGINGPKTQAAIKSYQRMLGVTADGIWGSNTQAAYDRKMNPPAPAPTPKPTNTTSSNTTSSSNNNNTTSSNNNNTTSYNQPSQPSNGSVLFNAYGYTIYSNASVSLITAPDGSGRKAVKWTNPDGSYVWETVDGSNVKQYAPQYAPSSSQTNTSTTAPKTTTQIPTGTNLKVGSTGDAVKALQTFLGITADGIYGANTEAAVKSFQQRSGLTVDGIAGVNTLTAINKQLSPTTTTANPAAKNVPGQPNEYNPNTGVKLAPGETVLNQQTGKYVTQGQVGETSAPTTQPSVTSKFEEDYSKTGDTPTSLYNATGRNSDWEQPALQEEKGVEKAAVASNIISSQFMSKITSDPSIVGFYVNALAYGGYTIGDVLNDMKRREMIASGNTQAKSLKIIDPELNRNSYLATSDGQKSVQDTASIIPTFNLQGLLNPDILKYGANIPDELFKTLVPILDKNSQEFKDAVKKVKETYYDLASAQLQASTEQEKAVADYNLKNFTEQLNKQYGIQLSDDATKAWGQIEALEDTMSTRNISGSGLEQEGIDSYLNAARKQDARLRDEKLTKAEVEKASFYTSSASAAEIAKLTPEERKKYGLTPSSDILNKFSIAALTAQYPNKPADEIKAIHDSVIDENGNFRSTLYSKYYTQLATTATTNQTNAEQQVLLDAQNKENAAYRNYDQSQPFSVATAKDDATVKSNATTTSATTSNPPSSTSTSNNISPAASTAAANISASINNYNSNTGAKLTPGQTYVNSQGQTITQGTPVATSTSTASPNPSAVSTTPKTTVTSPSPTPSTSPTSYKIAYGDTLSAIAARNGTTTSKLAALNGISDPNKIIAGSTIRLK